MALSKELSKKESVCKVTFELSAESVNGATTAALLGDFNGWNATTHLLTKQKNGNFKTTIDLEAGRQYEFRYLLDGQTWLNDDQGDNYVWTRVSNDENFVVVVPESVPGSVPAQPASTKAASAKTSSTKATTAKAASTKATQKPASTKKTVIAKVEKAPAAQKVATKKASPAIKADDLTIIEGIGPKAAQVLIAGGISTFAELAKAKATAVKSILTATEAKVGHLDPTTWAQQAKLAAAGKFEALEVLKKELNNGKVVK